MTAAAACRTCGTEPLANARFCHGCGSPVVEPETHAEYKQVTVLFADVVRSMDIASVVGPERLREIMAELADHCAAVVQRYGSTVDKFTGDGIMAIFGAPVSLEDHAVRAPGGLGVSERTVRRDLARDQATAAFAAVTEEPIETVVSLDGRRRPASRREQFWRRPPEPPPSAPR